MPVELFDVRDTARMQAALAVRIAVFVEEQGVPLAEEIDAHDRDDERALHAIVRDADGRVVGAGRYYERDARTVQLGRMAVLKSARGTGAGTAILEALMEAAKSRGYTSVSLSAQVHAMPFYRRLRFAECGPRFQDAGIEHQEMTRDI